MLSNLILNLCLSHAWKYNGLLMTHIHLYLTQINTLCWHWYSTQQCRLRKSLPSPGIKYIKIMLKESSSSLWFGSALYDPTLLCLTRTSHRSTQSLHAGTVSTYTYQDLRLIPVKQETHITLHFTNPTPAPHDTHLTSQITHTHVPKQITHFWIELHGLGWFKL